jgi:hypothetical protein
MNIDHSICINKFFFPDSSDKSAEEDDPEEAPVLLRRRRFTRRKDRAVHSLETSLDSLNYDTLPPPLRKVK